jgi:hypothetical protein
MKRWLGFAKNGTTRFALLLPLVPLLLCAAGSVLLLGCELSGSRECNPGDDCETSVEEPPFGTMICHLPEQEASLIGICIPYVDAGWHTALVRMAYPEEGELTCPESAKWPGLWGAELTAPNVERRNVIGCSVQPSTTCGHLSMACVPREEDYPPCVLQANQNSCPGSDSALIPYTVLTKVEPYGGGDPTTVCCQEIPNQK